MSLVFVTATGTDAGKTFVTALLVRALREQGKPVHALKPVISGYSDDGAADSDSGVLLDALGMEPTPEAVAEISPWRFEPAISPDMAARRAGVAIDPGSLTGFCRGADRASGVTFVEGVGGIMVPLNDTATVLDWMTDLGAPVLLVAGTYLGTISHTLSAYDVTQQRGLDVRAVILSESEDNPVPPAETVDTLGRFIDPAKLFLIGRNAGTRAVAGVLSVIP